MLKSAKISAHPDWMTCTFVRPLIYCVALIAVPAYATDTNNTGSSNTISLSTSDTLTNSGTITGTSSGVALCSNQTYIAVCTALSSTNTTITNLGTLSGTGVSASRGWGIYSRGSTSIVNGSTTNTSAVIEGYWHGISFENSGTSTIENFAVIQSLSSGSNAGININDSSASVTIVNYSTGQILGPPSGASSSYDAGIVNYGSIPRLTNAGLISGATYDIASWSTITTLDNAQGKASSSLKYTGALPTNYNVIVRSTTDYGQLTYIQDTNWGFAGTTTFGIYTGGVSGVASSTLTPGTYTSVLTGVQSSYLVGATTNSLTGTTLGYNWTLKLVDSVNLVWNLIVQANGPDATYTTTALRTNATALRGVMDRRLSGLGLMTSYDCATFDKSGYCVSFQARYSNFDSMNDGAGVLTAAYRLSERGRVGAFVDYRASENAPTNIKFSNDLPTFGLFAAYSEGVSGTGLQGKVLTAFQKGDATITRAGDTSLNTESGSGKASLNSHVVSGELGWGFALSSQMVATPFAGLRYTNATRGAYDESTVTGSVDYPMSYQAYSQRLTTGVVGVRVAGMITDNIGYQGSAGLEHDLRQQVSNYSGSSSVSGLETFALTISGANNRTRPVGSASLFYQLDKSQRLTGSVSVRNQAFTSQAMTSVMGGYQVAF